MTEPRYHFDFASFFFNFDIPFLGLPFYNKVSKTEPPPPSPSPNNSPEPSHVPIKGSPLIRTREAEHVCRAETDESGRK